MKKAALLICVVLCFQIAAYGQSLSPEDRAKGVAYLEKTRDGVVEATKGLTRRCSQPLAAPMLRSP